MSFTDAVRTCLRKYATFSGRASRSEYWWFVLFLFLCSLVLGLADQAFFGTELVQSAPGQVNVSANGPLNSIFSLAMFLPTLAAGWRRMHDTGRSGLYLLYPLIAFVGVMAFAGLFFGFEAVARGDFSGLVGGIGGIILVFSMLVLLVSPLLVLWWLTRPSQPDSNDWGPPPRTAA
ncbi:DUF805 domain-containing protein [Rhodobacteraceae bacterium CCMM004]|nr:DUF805 domain-containing protein [Rhodobacteraceae bacterium CCMM004]